MTSSGNWSGAPDSSPSSSSSSGGHSRRSSVASECDPSFLSGLDTTSDVAEAIDACRKAVLESAEGSDARRDLVNRLIRLRIRQQDLRDRADEAAAGGIGSGNVRKVRGHILVPYSRNTIASIPGLANPRRGVYCQQCCSTIWMGLQASRHCRECGFSTHLNCLESSDNGPHGPVLQPRACVAEKVRTKPDFIMKICPERTLPELKFRCVECDRRLSWDIPGLEPRLCDYTGLSFCPSCHWNARSVTPARIVHNWDFEARSVSQASKQYLFLMYRRPVIDVGRINPGLFAVAQELGQVHALRKKVILLKKYLSVCRIAAGAQMLQTLADRQHFVDGPDFYSLRDLVDTHSGVLRKYLEEKSAEMAGHVRGCVLCFAKGFFCEICDGEDEDGDGDDSMKKTVLFPFDDDAASCDECEGVFHKECFRPGADCPRCSRKKKRIQNTKQQSGS